MSATKALGARFTGEVHPYADAFPMMPTDDLDALADDIDSNGLLHPLVLDTDGRLLDGRNRLAACERAGVKPRFTVHDGDPYALIVSANTHRRQMTAGQVAAARALALAEQGKRQNGRWVKGSTVESSTVGKDYMAWAGRVLDHDTATLRQVIVGTRTLPDAYADVNERRKADERTTKQTAELRDRAPDLAEMVTAGELPLDEAYAAYEARTRDEREAEEQRAKALHQSAIGLTEAIALLGSITDRTVGHYLIAMNEHAPASMLRLLGTDGFAATAIDAAIDGLDVLRKEMHGA